MQLFVNGRSEEAEAPLDATLLTVLREHLGHTEVKEGCSTGTCGACLVRVDGALRNACLILAAQAEGASVETVTSLPPSWSETFARRGAVQCGLCSPGMLMAASRLKPGAGEQEVREALEGNLCRCTGYVKIVEAVKEIVQ